MSALLFRERARSGFGLGVSAPPTPFCLQLSSLRLRRLGGREGNGRRGRDDDIRRLGRNGASIALIVRGAGVSEPTVRKYLRKPGLSDRPGRREGAGVATV